MKKLLVLGGLGLIAHEVMSRVQGEYEEIIIADIKCTYTVEGKFHFVPLNLLEKGALSDLLQKFQPNTIINGINVATLFSNMGESGYGALTQFYIDLHESLSKLTMPLRYLQIGTTGSGGLGFTIPFTHGGSKEEYPIIRKAACAGITTALLTLLSRSFPPEMVRVSEIKPGLIIFSDEVGDEDLGGVKLAVANGGENGKYTHEELALVTSIMGFTSVRRLADHIVSVLRCEQWEIKMVQHDAVSALNAAIISPEKNEEVVLEKMLKELEILQGSNYIIATGDLGPPALTRDLLLAFGVIHRLSMHDSYEAFIANNICLSATYDFIKKRNPTLADFIKTTSNEAQFAAVKTLHGEGDAPWQLVRKLLFANLK